MDTDKWSEIKEKISYIFMAIIFILGGGLLLYMFTPELHDNSIETKSQSESEEYIDRL